VANPPIGTGSTTILTSTIRTIFSGTNSSTIFIIGIRRTSAFQSTTGIGTTFTPALGRTTKDITSFLTSFKNGTTKQQKTHPFTGVGFFIALFYRFDLLRKFRVNLTLGYLLIFRSRCNSSLSGDQYCRSACRSRCSSSWIAIGKATSSPSRG
jgi:hypothetical protein